MGKINTFTKIPVKPCGIFQSLDYLQDYFIYSTQVDSQYAALPCWNAFTMLFSFQFHKMQLSIHVLILFALKIAIVSPNTKVLANYDDEELQRLWKEHRAEIELYLGDDQFFEKWINDPNATQVAHVKRLHDQIFSHDTHFDRLVRPNGFFEWELGPNVTSQNQPPLQVELGLSLVQMVNVDIRNQMMISNVFLHIQWRDERLTWDPRQYGGVKHITIVPDAIWQPGIILYNS